LHVTAAVTRIEVAQRYPVAAGVSFGSTGHTNVSLEKFISP
jgi:hypothetical protein